jgi:hypothetical protein
MSGAHFIPASGATLAECGRPGKKEIPAHDEMTHSSAMVLPVDTKDAAAVAREAGRVFHQCFPSADARLLDRGFGWVVDCFAGRCPGYQAIDARYHDLEHTLQGTLCLMRLLGGRHAAEVEPVLTPRMFELGLLAILMHDTGYLKRAEDRAGTGAKYTVTHVERSVAFAREFLAPRGFNGGEISSIQNMIRCTGVDANLKTIPFGSDLERAVGFALGTADLLGQMAAADYVGKLPVLHAEFAEAVAFSGFERARSISFPGAEELLRATPAFWRNFVRPKLDEDFAGLHEFLNEPYPDGPNLYIEAIQQNLALIEERFHPGA